MTLGRKSSGHNREKGVLRLCYAGPDDPSVVVPNGNSSVPPAATALRDPTSGGTLETFIIAHPPLMVAWTSLRRFL